MNRTNVVEILSCEISTAFDFKAVDLNVHSTSKLDVAYKCTYDANNQTQMAKQALPPLSVVLNIGSTVLYYTHAYPRSPSHTHPAHVTEGVSGKGRKVDHQGRLIQDTGECVERDLAGGDKSTERVANRLGCDMIGHRVNSLPSQYSDLINISRDKPQT